MVTVGAFLFVPRGNTYYIIFSMPERISLRSLIMSNTQQFSLKNFDSVMTFFKFAGATTLAVGCFHLADGLGWSIGNPLAFYLWFVFPAYFFILPLNVALTVVATFFHPQSWRIWLPGFLYLLPVAALINEVQDLFTGLAWILHGTVSLAISIRWSKYSGRGSI